MTTLVLDADLIREGARGLWRNTIYSALGIDVGHGKHMPCPYCGGNDRFRCDDRNGSGSWYCNQCDPHAGDGFALIQKVGGCSFGEALRRVADVLCLSPSSLRSRPRPRPTPKQLDLRSIASKFEIHGVVLEQRANATLQRNYSTAAWSDDDLDFALNNIAQAYHDRERAQLLFELADRFRARAYEETCR